MTIEEIKKFITEELDKRNKMILRNPFLDAYNKGVMHALENIYLMLKATEEKK